MRDSGLIPGMFFVDGIAERIVSDKGLRVLPILVIRRPKQNADPQVDVYEIGGDKLTIHDDSGGDIHRFAPFVHRPIVIVTNRWILE